MKRRLLLVLLVATFVGVVVLETPRVAAQTLLLIPSLMDAPVKPLEWVSGAPQRVTLTYREPGSEDRADLWLPSGARADQSLGGAVLVLGVNNLGRDHPAVRRVAGALARSGVAVLVPDSAALLEGRLDAGEIDGVVRSFQALARRPEVDPERLSLVGFSAGGTLALLAAADPRIAGRVQYVNAFGAFADARSYVASLAARAYRLDGREVRWTPTRLALEGFPRLVLGHVRDPLQRQLLTAAVQPLATGGRLTLDSRLAARLDPDARAIYRLLAARNLAEADRAVAALPARVRALLDDLSPVRGLGGVKAKVHLMHELDDNLVPFVESRKLATALSSQGLLVRHTEFRLFSHVQPDDVDAAAAAPELWKLLWHVHGLMTETL